MGSNFSPFPQYFQYIFLIKGVKLQSFVNFGCSNCFFFPQYYKSDMSKYGYLEVFKRVPSISR